MLALTAAGSVLSWGTGWQGQLGRAPKAVFDSYAAARDKYKSAEHAFEEAQSRSEEVQSDAAATTDARKSAAAKCLEAERQLQAAKLVFEPQEREFRRLQLTPEQVPIEARWACPISCHRAKIRKAASLVCLGYPRLAGGCLSCRIDDIACGSYTSFAIDAQGRAWSWGLDNYGQASGEPLQPDMSPDSEVRSPSPCSILKCTITTIKAASTCQAELPRFSTGNSVWTCQALRWPHPACSASSSARS